MKRGFTYKELTLLIGIVVAIVVAVLVLATDPSGITFNETSSKLPSLKLAPFGSRVIETTLEIIF